MLKAVTQSMESSWTIAGIQENEGDGCCFPEKGRQGGAGTESGSHSWRLVVPCRSHLFFSLSLFPLPFLSQIVTEAANTVLFPPALFFPCSRLSDLSFTYSSISGFSIPHDISKPHDRIWINPGCLCCLLCHWPHFSEMSVWFKMLWREIASCAFLNSPCQIRSAQTIISKGDSSRWFLLYPWCLCLSSLKSVAMLEASEENKLW